MLPVAIPWKQECTDWNSGLRQALRYDLNVTRKRTHCTHPVTKPFWIMPFNIYKKEMSNCYILLDRN
jgi:hypothetical protein